MGRTESIIFLIIGTMVFLALIASLLLFVYYYRKKTIEYQKEQERARQQLLATRLEIQEQTMQHIGQEIHDSVAQKLTLASLYAYTLVLNRHCPEIEASLSNIGGLINETLAELRALSKNLTDSEFLTASLESLIEHECNKVQALGRCRVTTSINGPPINIPFDARVIILRLVQEFLQNSLKHAFCRNITVRVNNSSDGLTINAADDGIGFNPAEAEGKGVGLRSMKQRAAIIGARVQVESQPEQGVTLNFFMPAP